MSLEGSDGWDESAKAWIKRVDEGDLNRELVLDPAIGTLLGDVRGQNVCDVGCGEGRTCRRLSSMGAQPVGIDPTRLLVEEARRRHPEGKYVQGDAEKLPFAGSSFDIVLSYVTLIDIPDFRKGIAEMVRVLKPGGRLIVANLNSFATSVPSGWIRNEEGEKVFFPLDNYMDERPDWVEWCGIKVVNWHRPLSAYMQAYLENGLVLKHFSEPLPSAEAIERHPSYSDYYRLAYFNLMEWHKRPERL